MVGGREQARAEVEAARELGCRMTIHTNCFKSPDAFSEIEVLRERHLMGPDLLFVHVNQATDDELKAVVDSGGSISVTPETEMQMGMGRPVTGRFLAAGGKPTFGADDPVATVVMHAHPGNVDSVLVAGKVLKRNGRLTAEMTRVRLMVRESQEQLLAALAEVQATIPSTYRFKN